MSDIPKKADLEGWVEVGKMPTRIVPIFCPKCGRKLHKTDAGRLCGIIFVYCNGPQLTKDSCRWCEEFRA